MSSNQVRICKDCGKPFELTTQEIQYFSKKRIGLTQMVPPVRCVNCRNIHREQVRNLGRVTVRIPNAESGEGCYLALTAADLEKIMSWGTTTFPWKKVAPDKYPDQAQAVMFNIDQSTVGVVYFEDGGPDEGLSVKAIEYAPEVDTYERSRSAIPLYLITESIRRGYGGRFTFKPKKSEVKFYSDLGMTPLPGDKKTYVMSAQSAQHILLTEEGVREDTIQKLITRAEQGQADLAWIARKVAQKKLSPEMVDEITKAKSGISWKRLQTCVENQDLFELETFNKLGRKLQGLFGQLQTVEFLNNLDPGITLRTEMQVMSQSVDIVAAVSKPVKVPQCQTFDAVTDTVQTVSLKLRPPQGCAIECKAWKTASYRREGNIDVLEHEVRQTLSVFNTVIVFVTSDFNKLPDTTKTDIVRRVTESGGYLKVLPGFSSVSAAYQAGMFITFLG